MFGERNVDPAQLAAMRAQLGLDQPLIVQYGLYLWHVLHGDLGRSLSTHDSVLAEFLTLFPATVELAVSAMLIAVADRHPGRHHRRPAARQHRRLHGDGAGAHRLFDADLLVGDPADPAVLGDARPDAGQRRASTSPITSSR